MPTYDYVCQACGHEFEKFQSITASPVRKCPQCGKRRVKRLIGTGAGIIFKGSGFYCTDYRSDSYRKSAAGDKGGSSASDGKGGDSKGSDSKGADGASGTKSADSKPAESKSAAEAKPAKKTAKAE